MRARCVLSVEAKARTASPLLLMRHYRLATSDAISFSTGTHTAQVGCWVCLCSSRYKHGPAHERPASTWHYWESSETWKSTDSSKSVSMALVQQYSTVHKCGVCDSDHSGYKHNTILLHYYYCSCVSLYNGCKVGRPTKKPFSELYLVRAQLNFSIHRAWKKMTWCLERIYEGSQSCGFCRNKTQRCGRLEVFRKILRAVKLTSFVGALRSCSPNKVSIMKFQHKSWINKLTNWAAHPVFCSLEVYVHDCCTEYTKSGKMLYKYYMYNSRMATKWEMVYRKTTILHTIVWL